MNFPDILAGPILRRTEKKEIYCWIALSKLIDTRTEIYNVQQTDDEFFLNCVSSNCETTIARIGENLFIYLMKATPKEEAFPTEQLLGYNVFFSDKSIEWNLADYQLLDHHHPSSIVYGNLPLPSFFITEAESASFLYGSCQKLHGIGKDALTKGDSQLADYWSDLKKRPSSLFLLGDQIYADDVADPITPFIQLLGEKLIGKQEAYKELPIVLGPDYDISFSQVNGRAEMMKELCCFTSTKAANHLITLGEYAAMYLLSWSPALWETAKEANSFLSFDELLAEDKYYMDETLNTDKALETRRKKYEEQANTLAQFAISVPKIRRLMANLPVYMIFDDHDITDDWNISNDWMQKVGNAPLGRHVIANGLTAYWAFQGWGNAPETFSERFLAAIHARLKGSSIQSKDYESWLSSMWLFSNWHYTIPSTPVTLVLDTRTQRFYPEKKPNLIGSYLSKRTKGPNLIKKEAWQKLEKSLYASNWKKGEKLILLSATPLYGVDLIESFLKRIVLPISNTIPNLQETMDLEWWKFNGRGYHEFHNWLAKWNPSECIILSGDAHMAYALHSEVEHQHHGKRTIHQYTSSPIKNESFRGLASVALKGSLFLGNQLIKKNVTHRYCDYHYLLCEGETTSDYIWKEKIQHETLDSGFIIKTNNNLGLLEVSPPGITNKFL